MSVLRFLISCYWIFLLALTPGRVVDPLGGSVAGAVVRVEAGGREIARAVTDERGEFAFWAAPGTYRMVVEAAGFQPEARDVRVSSAGEPLGVTLRAVATSHESLTVSAKAAEELGRELFTRDDQLIQQLNSGIDAGQHEGGGKSLEIRRFGFNLDHGGVNGGLKVLVDAVPQNQATQGHGQGYLGSLKALSPELIQDVTVIDGPFSPEYGDFSGLGVVHIRQRESLPDQITARVQGGNFDSSRGFLAYSPDAQRVDAYAAYEGSFTDGPFINPGRYRRDNVNANYTRTLIDGEKLGFRLLAARNDFDSSGQIPLDLVNAGALDRFGYIDPSDGGRVRMATASTYYTKQRENGDTFKADGFVSRSLFDLYSDFTYFLHDPVHGDAIQQHDSRLQEGVNAQYSHPHRLRGLSAVLLSGANFHDNEINVGLYPREGRVPTGLTTRANAHVTNEAGYVQENVSLLGGRLVASGGLRFDEFRFGVMDRVEPQRSGVEWAGRWQGKGTLAYTPWRRVPVTLTANHGRGINSVDARGIVEHPEQVRLATTDFYQAGISSHFGRVAMGVDAFRIDHSNEQVYIPDDGTFEFKGPSRSYGYEAKASVAITRKISLNGGMTKIGNSYFLGGGHRVYVDSAPHFVANAALTLAGWHGWSGSVRTRAINHYRLDGEDPSIVASGHTVFDFGATRQLRRGVELNLSVDNALNRSYYETQNWFESQVAPNAPAVWRIHGTPGYPLTAVVGLTFHLRGK
jgi:hypothetical protein